MPNHVTNKIVFDSAKAEEVFAACCPGGRFDFETLVPSPNNMYCGNLGKAEDEDFPINWHSWSRTNWGTKWNAYSQECGIENGKAFIKFQTAWSVPYPVMAAFANKFHIPFQHRYACERTEYWGIEDWGNDRFDNSFCRTKKDYNNPDHKRELCVELWGSYPEDEE